jgi:hypothetical protein
MPARNLSIYPVMEKWRHLHIEKENENDRQDEYSNYIFSENCVLTLNLVRENERACVKVKDSLKRDIISSATKHLQGNALPLPLLPGKFHKSYAML